MQGVREEGTDGWFVYTQKHAPEQKKNPISTKVLKHGDTELEK